MKLFKHKFSRKNKWLIFLGIIVVFIAWCFLDKPSLKGDWQEQLMVISTAEFDGDFVTVRNVRNFRYFPNETDVHLAYYDRTYDLNQVKKIWYIAEPFDEGSIAAHTFVSFEFNDGNFLSISIEARKLKGQEYGIWRGLLHTFPLVYIAADERDTVLSRANILKNKVYVYPVKLGKPENARLLLVDMLRRMNELTTTKPAWYNTVFANCTSLIAGHINKLDSGRISIFSWQLLFTASADELALKQGLLDTDLSIQEARKKFYINEISERVWDVPEYSNAIREK